MTTVAILLLVMLAQCALMQAQRAPSHTDATRPKRATAPDGDDDGDACGSSLYLELAKANTFCPFGTFPTQTPDAICCKGLVDYFGANSTEPTRDCLCDAEVWGNLTENTVYDGISFQGVFSACNQMGPYIIPYYGSGLCNSTSSSQLQGGSSNQSASAKAGGRSSAGQQMTTGPMVSFSKWVASLSNNWLVLVAFITSIISGPGFLIFLWPFGYEFVLALTETVGKSTALQSTKSLSGKP